MNIIEGKGKMINIMAIGIFSCSLFGCSNGQAGDKLQSSRASIPGKEVTETTVTTAMVRSGNLRMKLYVNGHIEAFDRVDIKFETSGRMISSQLKNGQFVLRGSQLAQIDDMDLQYELANEKIDLLTAENNRNERMMLVSGGNFGDSTVTEQQLEYINIVSGYYRAEQIIKETRYHINKTSVTAPFDGLVADLKIKKNEFARPGEILCTLIGPDSYEASFDVTEDVAVKLENGQSVSVTSNALPGLTVPARIVAINPRVNENGLVSIYARLLRGQKRFFEGMNVVIAIESDTPASILIPREALVLRSGKEVVFTLDNSSGLAKWNYVTVSFENDELFGVTKGLDEGDLVIVEGNRYLDHGVKIKVVEEF